MGRGGGLEEGSLAGEFGGEGFSCFCLDFVFVSFALFLFCCWIVFGVVLVFVFQGFFSCLFLFVFLFVLVCFVCLSWSVSVAFVFSCCVLGLFCFVLCVCWSGLGVVLVLLCLVCFVCVFYLFLCVCFFLSLMKIHCFPCNSSVLGFNVGSIVVLISVSGSCFCFCFVCFLFQDVPLFVFCLLSCFGCITK